MFYTAYNRPPRTKTPCGTKTIAIYKEDVNEKTGKRELKKIKETNVYDRIQMFKEETDTYNIIEHYKQTGDPSLLNKRTALYGDFSSLPTSPIEFQNKMMKAEKEFNSLDREVRETFENDVNVFRRSVINGTFKEKMKKFIKEEKTVEQTETKIQIQGDQVNE